MSRHPGRPRDPAPGEDPADPVVRAEPADRTDRADLAEPHLVDRRPAHRRPAEPVGARRVVRAEPMGPADRARRRPAAPRPVDRHPRDPVDPDMDLAARVAPRPVNLVVRAGPDPVGMARVDLGDLVRRVGLAVPVDTDLADLAAPVSLDRVDPAARVGRANLTVLADLVARVAHHRRRMCSTAPSIGVARSSAVRETHRTASAPPTTVHRHRPRSAGSVGTTDLRPAVLRQTGMGRPLPVDGTVRHLPVAGTRGGTVPAAT